MAETVLVTGGSGFIAGWIMRRLLEQGYAVRATLRDVSKAEAVRAAVAAEGAGDRLTFVQADLLFDEGWDTAMAGCDYVIHAASPLGGGKPGDRYSLVPAARDGTLRVVKAAVAARVKRIVMTSAAATARPPLASRRVSDETVWANPDDRQFDAYRVSKILAELSAWEFMSSVGQTARFAAILPGAVFGPILTPGQTGAVDIIGGLLRGRPPILPRLGFWITDVRDLADMHILWMAEMAEILRESFTTAKVPALRAPDLLMRVLMAFSPTLRPLSGLLGQRFPLTAAKARRVLGYAPRPVSDSLIECGESLIS